METTDLSKNENIYGPSPKGLKILKNAKKEDLNFYSRNNLLKEFLIKKYSILDSNLLLSYGTEDILIHLFEELINPEDTVLIPEQTWPYFTEMIKKRGAKIAYFQLELNENEFIYNVNKIKDSIKINNPKIILIPSPNNPTGNVMSVNSLTEILNTFKGIVILDEAYKDFSSKDHFMGLIDKYPNLIILRSFSKYYGLAGLRMAFGICSSKLKEKIKYFDKYLGMCEILEKVVISSVKDKGYYNNTWREICKNRDDFCKEINKLKDFTCYKSQGNFVLIKINSDKFDVVVQKLNQKKIIVKRYDQHPFQNCIRITIGKAKDMNNILNIFKILG